MEYQLAKAVIPSMLLREVTHLVGGKDGMTLLLTVERDLAGHPWMRVLATLPRSRNSLWAFRVEAISTVSFVRNDGGIHQSFIVKIMERGSSIIGAPR